MFAHKSGFWSKLISIRNSVFRRNFPNSTKNLKYFLTESHGSGDGTVLYELGVGYTFTDSLILRFHYGYSRVVLVDIQPLLEIRLFCMVSLLLPVNYFNIYFWKSYKLLLCGLIFGRTGIEAFGFSYNVTDKIEFPRSCDIFSNAVFEHVSCGGVNVMFNEISGALGGGKFYGIIDTVDHKNRRKPRSEQFCSLTSSELDLQERGNGLSPRDWSLIFSKFFSQYTVELHPEDHEEAGIIVYKASVRP